MTTRLLEGFDRLFNAAAGAGQGLAIGIPMGQSQRLARGEKAGMSPIVVVFAFRVLGTAVFAEPSVPEIEEVIGLVHKKGAWPVLAGPGQIWKTRLLPI